MYTIVLMRYGASTWNLENRFAGWADKAETAAGYGAEQVFAWRCGYDVQPGPLALDDRRSCHADPRYAALEREQVPLAESLNDTVGRVQPIWDESIAPAIRTGKKIIIAAHGNSLRALIKILDCISGTISPHSIFPMDSRWCMNLTRS
jgi:2,3-bisphosphoglycerate-dependent phosphoglycerate mutase